MDKDVCGSRGVYNILPDISLDNMFLSVYNWYYLQVVLSYVEDCCSAGLDWYLDQTEDLSGASRPIQVIL